MRAAVGRDDARIVHHLHEDHHVPGGLHYLIVIVVGDRKHRRPRARAKGEQAALGEGPLLGVLVQAERRRILRVVRSGDGAAPGGTGPGDSLLRLGGQRRHLSVGRVDDERRPPLPVHHRELGPRIPEEGVVRPLDVGTTSAVAAILVGRLEILLRVRGGFGL